MKFLKITCYPAKLMQGVNRRLMLSYEAVYYRGRRRWVVRFVRFRNQTGNSFKAGIYSGITNSLKFSFVIPLFIEL